MSLWVALAIAVWTVLGWAVVSLVAGGRAGSAGRRWARFGLAIGTGMGATAVAQFWAGCVGLRMSLTAQLVSAGVLTVAAGLVAGWRSLAARRTPPPGPEPVCGGRDDRRPAEQQPSAALDRLLIGAIALAVGLVFVQSIRSPLTQWDSRVIWGFKAKLLYDAGTLHTEDFHDPDRVHRHPRYPLLLPLAEASLWQWTGRVDERSVKVISPLFVAALALVLAGAVRDHVGRTQALALCALVAWCPMLCIHEWGARSAHADVPLAFFHTVSTLCLVRWLTTGTLRGAALAGLMAAFGIFTKNEGLALWAINVTCAGVASLFVPGWRRRAGWLVFVGVAVLVSLPWFVVQSGLPTVSDENYLARILAGGLGANVARVPQVAAAVAAEMFLAVGRWSVLWYVIGVMILTHIRAASRPGPAMVLAALVLYVAAVVAMYTVSPWDDVSVHMAVSLPRVLLHVLPVAVCLVGLQLDRSPSGLTDAGGCVRST